MSHYETILNKYKKDIIDFRRHLHQYPELSFQEFNTTQYIKDRLKDTDIQLFDLTQNTGLIGLLEINPDYKYIAFRADIDALPIEENTNLEYHSQNKNVMHACGHDIHSSILYGFAKVVNEIQDQLKVNLVFIFQPAEEIAEGAIYIEEELNKLNIPVDEIIMYHTWPTLEEGMIGYRYKDMMAGNASFEITLKTKGGHGAHPETTADPVYISSNIVQFIQGIGSRFNNPTDPLVITVASIHAGEARNVIPDELTMGGTIRSFSDQSMDKAISLINKYIESLTEVFDFEFTFKIENQMPAVNNDKMIVEKFIQSGGNNFIELEEPSMGSEDFAYYLKQNKGAAFRIGTQIKDEPSSALSLHSSEIIFSEKAIFTGIRGFLDYVSCAKTLSLTH